MQELPMSFMDKTGPLQPLLEPLLKSVLGVVVDMKVDFEVEMFWNRVNGERVIQAHAPPQPPVIGDMCVRVVCVCVWYVCACGMCVRVVCVCVW